MGETSASISLVNHEPEEKTEDKIEEAASDDENPEIQNQTENNKNAENN